MNSLEFYSAPMNSPRQIFTSACCILILFLSNSFGARSEPGISTDIDQNAVTIRSTSALPENAIDFIARKSIPGFVIVPPTKRIEDIVFGLCGNYTKQYENVMLELNKGLQLGSSSTPRKILLPACVKWRLNSTVLIRTGDNLSTLTLREIGKPSDYVLQKCDQIVDPTRCDKTLEQLIVARNPGLKPLQLVPNTFLEFPVITYSTTFRIRPEAGLSSTTFVDRINEQVKPIIDKGGSNPLIIIEPAKLVRLVEPVGADDIRVMSPACQATGSPVPTWPFDPVKLASVIRRDVALDKTGRGRSTIAILDTGLTGIPSIFEERWFVKNRKAVRNAVRPRPGQTYAGDVYGVNIALRTGDFGPDPKYEWAQHGTQVANLALGGVAFRRSLQDLASLVGLKIVNIVSPKNLGHPTMDESALLGGLRYAGNNGAVVANISASSYQRIEGVIDILRSFPDLIYVVAAGNDSNDLKDVARYPAVFGGALEDRIITVAASDRDGKLAEFSNWSENYVDLLAPGCAMPDNAAGVATTALFGTSYAAPLVSMTVALLRRFGVEPSEIKDRLYAGSDFNPETMVKSKGNLNIIKSLSLYDDIVQTDGKIYFGSWIVSGSVDVCEDSGPYEVGDILKISYFKSANQIRLLRYDDAGKVADFTCNSKGDGIKFRPLGSDVDIDVPWGDLIDLVPRYFGKE